MRRAHSASGSLVVASYNVHRCVGVDGRRDPVRIAAVIEELDAELVALQEISGRGGGPTGGDLASIARALGFEAIEGPTLRDRGEPYGNALLTRLPVRRVERVDLSVPGREPRGALVVELEHRGEPLSVVATHLGLDRRERRAQVERLLAVCEERRERWLALLGDLNEWRPLRGGLAPLEAFFGDARRPRTFPARWPVLALDRVWARPRGAIQAIEVHRSAAARVASDHLPVRARLRSPAAPDGNPAGGSERTRR